MVKRILILAISAYCAHSPPGGLGLLMDLPDPLDTPNGEQRQQTAPLDRGRTTRLQQDQLDNIGRNILHAAQDRRAIRQQQNENGPLEEHVRLQQELLVAKERAAKLEHERRQEELKQIAKVAAAEAAYNQRARERASIQFDDMHQVTSDTVPREVNLLYGAPKTSTEEQIRAEEEEEVSKAPSKGKDLEPDTMVSTADAVANAKRTQLEMQRFCSTLEIEALGSLYSQNVRRATSSV